MDNIDLWIAVEVTNKGVDKKRCTWIYSPPPEKKLVVAYHVQLLCIFTNSAAHE